MAAVSLALDFPGHLPTADRTRLTVLAERNLADHGEGFLGLVLSGSAGRAMATETSDLDVFVVLSDDAAAGRTTARSPDVDEIPWSRSELDTVGPFGSEEWWFRWSCAWAPVLLDRSDGDIADALRRQATLTPDEADAVLIDHDRLDGWVNFAYRALKNDRDGRPFEARLAPRRRLAGHELLGLVERMLDGDVSAVRETLPRVRDACAAYDRRRGHSRTSEMMDGWGTELELFA